MYCAANRYDYQTLRFVLIHFLFDLRRCCDNIEIEQAFPSGEKKPRLISRFKKQDHYKNLNSGQFRLQSSSAHDVQGGKSSDES